MQPLWRTIQRFLNKVEIELPYDPAIHTEETRIERHTCAPVFIAALFTIARTWKQPTCLADNGYRSCGTYIHNGILLSHEKEQS